MITIFDTFLDCEKWLDHELNGHPHGSYFDLYVLNRTTLIPVIQVTQKAVEQYVKGVSK